MTACPWRTFLYRTEFSWARLMPLLSLVASLLLTLPRRGAGIHRLPGTGAALVRRHLPVFATSLLTPELQHPDPLIASQTATSSSITMSRPSTGCSPSDRGHVDRSHPLTAASIMAARNSLLREMKHLAHHDHLTGALNRAGFWSAANELLQHLTVQRYPVAICMLDIDHFKRINDRHGHEEGDNQLSSFAVRVRDQLRPGISLSPGGEELWPSGPASARSRPWRWSSGCENRRAAREEREPSPPSASRSASVSPPREGPFNLDELLSRADQALIWPSTMAANRVERYSAEQASPQHRAILRRLNGVPFVVIILPLPAAGRQMKMEPVRCHLDLDPRQSRSQPLSLSSYRLCSPICTTWQPACRALAMPAGASSNTRQSAGASPNRLAASKRLGIRLAPYHIPGAHQETGQR